MQLQPLYAAVGWCYADFMHKIMLLKHALQHHLNYM